MQFKKILKLTYVWKFLVCVSYFAVIWYLTVLSKKVSFQQGNPPNSSKIILSLDFCYKLMIRDDVCSPSYSSGSREKLDFPTGDDCIFEEPIEW